MIDVLSSIDVVGSFDVLAQASTNGFGKIDVSKIKELLGLVLGIILALVFVAALGGMAWELFQGRNGGGADREVLMRYIFAIVAIVVFSALWVMFFGESLTVKPTLDGEFKF